MEETRDGAQKLPIVVQGKLLGALEIYTQGHKTIFEAHISAAAAAQNLPSQSLLRLSVYGPTGEGYLGVMMPCEDGLYLRRSLTPLALRAFPDTFLRAGAAGEPDLEPEITPEPESEIDSLPKAMPTPPDEIPESGIEPESELELESVSATSVAVLEPEPELAPDPAPAPVSKPVPLSKPATVSEPAAAGPEPELDMAPPDEALYWYASTDGALVCFDGQRHLLALKPTDPRIPPDIPGTQKEIEGELYRVFETKDGRLLR